jgi:ataxia telangiectasia mutated family protein
MSKNTASTVKGIIQQVKSEKITERQQGLQAIRDLFGQDHIVAKFHVDGNVAKPKAWLIVFQGLFEAVLNEKMAYLKQVGKATSSAATARRRLTDAANTVRWLTERTVQYLNSSVFQALLDHLYRTMMHKNDLLEPVALDYIKALRCLLEWTPHLDRIDVNKWVQIVEMAFNVVLGDPIKRSFSDDPADSAASPAPPPTEADDSEFFLENEDESEASSLASPTKKRRRRGATATPGPSSLHPSKPKRNQYKVPSKEQNELVPILSLLLRSSTAPLLLQDVAYLPSSILFRLQRFLEVYPADASLYHDYLLTVLSTLSHLSLNRKDTVVRFAQASWDSLVGLWGTKNKSMKECLVAVLRILFPFLTAGDDKGRATSYDWSTGISLLWRLLDGEAENRWGVDGLSLESLRLELKDEEEMAASAFVAQTFRAGYNFDPAQALAWAILELQADCAEKVSLFIPIVNSVDEMS